VIVAFVLVLLVGSLVLLWRSQERILFQPPRFRETSVESERVDYQAVDGQRLAGFLVGNPRTAPGVVLSFHGNAELALWQLDWARSLEARTGYAVLLSEYRGYMSLGGIPTYLTSKLDALAAREYLISTFALDQRRLVYFGHSLGSAIATELAAAHEPRVLLLQSPFSSARAMAGLMVMPPIGLIWKTISRIHFDTTRAVAGCPTTT
jgi:cephalosporin-C deacetylase-like acetyl esterase